MKILAELGMSNNDYHITLAKYRRGGYTLLALEKKARRRFNREDLLDEVEQFVSKVYRSTTLEVSYRTLQKLIQQSFGDLSMGVTSVYK